MTSHPHRRALLSGLILAAAGFPPREVWAAAPLPVVATFTILADFVQRVGGDAVAVTSLIGPDGDPHVFQPRPSDLARVSAAKLVVENGLGLEPWLARLVRASGFKGQSVVAGAGLATRTLPSQGRTVTDPHVWQNPRNAARMVSVIADALSAADPIQASSYRARANTFATAILEQDMAIERAFSEIPPGKRQVITSHDAFGYFGARYGITFRAAQGINTEAEPNPRDLAKLSAQIKREGIRVVFVENMTDPRIAKALAAEAGAVVGGKVFSDSLSPPQGPAASYLAMLQHNTALFLAAMRAA